VSNASEYIVIGAIVGAHGIKGDVRIRPLTDVPGQYDNLKSVYVNFNGDRRFRDIERSRTAHSQYILKFEGIDDRTSAERLKGALLERPLDDLAPLAEDEFFIFDLIGLSVKTKEGVHIGKLTDVMELPANDVYVVSGEKKEFLIPAIKDVIISIDLSKKEVIINPLDGLLD
jgi:16S rRNA processing protein RimM